MIVEQYCSGNRFCRRKQDFLVFLVFLFDVSEMLPLTDEAVLTTCLTFLDCDDSFRTFWDWKALLDSPIASKFSGQSKWLLCEIAARLCSLPEIQRRTLFNSSDDQVCFDR